MTSSSLKGKSLYGPNVRGYHPPWRVRHGGVAPGIKSGHFGFLGSACYDVMTEQEMGQTESETGL